MEENTPQPSPITMILYIIDNDKRSPSQNWEIIPKKKYTIGRSKKEVDLPLNLKLLSRKHAELIYYDSKTIMIKDLNSRNGTFINKLKIDPLKETFFTNKETLSFGNTNNEIVFFDNTEQHKDNLLLTDSDKSKESEIDKNEKSEMKIEINRENQKMFKNEDMEIINTDIKNKEKMEKTKNPIINERKEKESEREIEEGFNERERESNNNNNYEIYNKKSKEPSNQRELEREKNKQRSISNRDTYQNRKNYSGEREKYNSSYERRSGRYKLNNLRRESHNMENRSRSREANYSRSRSRSGSRETLVHQNNTYQERDYPPEKQSFNKEYYSYDIERENEKLRKEYLRRKEYEERRREEEEEYRKRKEREREMDKERDNYRERRRDNNRYFEEGNRIILKPEKLDIVMNQNSEDKRNNKDTNDGDMGYIKCYVEGYMYLRIKKSK